MGENPSPAQVLEAVKMLSSQYEKNSEANRALAREVARRKRETRFVALAVVLVVAVAIAAWLVVRHHDRSAEQDRRERLASQIFTQRESQVAGCERGNESRRADRETIEIALAPTEIPDGLSPELEALYRDAQERQAQKREQLLSRPGVQIIDCQAAHPPPRFER